MPAVVNAANCSVSALPAGGYLVTKTGGNAGTADASAVSAALAGDFVLRLRAPSDFVGYAGLSANPSASIAFNAIDRAVQLSGGTGRCYDGGLFRPPVFTPGGGCVWVRRKGGQLDYLHGPDLASATLVRSVAGVAGALGFDSAILSPGIALEVRFDVPAAFAGRKRRRLSVSLGL